VEQDQSEEPIAEPTAAEPPRGGDAHFDETQGASAGDGTQRMPGAEAPPDRHGEANGEAGKAERRLEPVAGAAGSALKKVGHAAESAAGAAVHAASEGFGKLDGLLSRRRDRRASGETQLPDGPAARSDNSDSVPPPAGG
jgi:hypothetical protein